MNKFFYIGKAHFFYNLTKIHEFFGQNRIFFVVAYNARFRALTRALTKV